jgi:hypothetical protein
MARQLRTQLEQEVQFDPLRDPPRASNTIRTPAPATAPPLDAQQTTSTTDTGPAASPDETHESKSA